MLIMKVRCISKSERWDDETKKIICGYDFDSPQDDKNADIFINTEIAQEFKIGEVYTLNIVKL